MKLSTVILAASSFLLSGAMAGPLHSSEVCNRRCFPHRPSCSPGWYAKQFGHCWTCCREHRADYYDYEYEDAVYDWE
ncbi:hypothetical protein BDV28DRAFT_145433 [Aspergillus coremiiformis]|uniref:Uncharacterized protein n=1 Tax=Aspergillus coremiiformis TaxID=138285 RepID=A0A5N6ZHK1_9EURO|nr:hypothetical protein BDV28DRAFT_145433 [Aspergillus coremiiformis]